MQSRILTVSMPEELAKLPEYKNKVKFKRVRFMVALKYRDPKGQIK